MHRLMEHLPSHPSKAFCWPAVSCWCHLHLRSLLSKLIIGFKYCSVAGLYYRWTGILSIHHTRCYQFVSRAPYSLAFYCDVHIIMTFGNFNLAVVRRTSRKLIATWGNIHRSNAWCSFLHLLKLSLSKFHGNPFNGLLNCRTAGLRLTMQIISTFRLGGRGLMHPVSEPVLVSCYYVGQFAGPSGSDMF